MEYKKIQSATFFAMLIGLSLFFAWLLKPYLYPIFWAAVIATLFHPLYVKILPKLKNRKNLAATITMCIAMLIIIIPMILIASMVVKQSLDIYNQFGNRESLIKISDGIQGYLQKPLIHKIAGDINVSDLLIKWSSNISSFIYSFIASASQNTVKFVVQFFIMMYTLYFFLKEGEVMLKKIMLLLPLGDNYEKRLYNRFVSTSKATLKGTFVIGIAQGTLGGLALYFAGVPGSVFWGVVMIFLCMIPSVGTFVVLIPAAVILFILGNIWQAIFVLVIMLISSFIDNFLRAPLVGKNAQMHSLFVFFSTIGGLYAFGITGVIIGPVITAFLISLWQIYFEKYKIDLERID